MDKHAVDAIAEALDQPKVSHHLYDAFIARKSLVGDIFDGHVPRQAAWRMAFEAIGIQRDTNAFAPDKVITVGYGIDQHLTHDGQGELGPIFAFESLHDAATLHVLTQPQFGSAYRFDQGIVDVFTHEFVAHGGAGILHEGDFGLGEEALDVIGKQQHARIGRADEVILLVHAAPFQQEINGVFFGNGPYFVHIAGDFSRVEVGDERVVVRQTLPRHAAPLNKQTAQGIGLEGHVFAVTALQVTSVDRVDVGQATRYIDNHNHHGGMFDQEGHGDDEGGGTQCGGIEHHAIHLVHIDHPFGA